MANMFVMTCVVHLLLASGSSNKGQAESPGVKTTNHTNETEMGGNATVGLTTDMRAEKTAHTVTAFNSSVSHERFDTTPGHHLTKPSDETDVAPTGRIIVPNIEILKIFYPNLTFQIVELLHKTKTKEYLDTISDEAKKSVIREQLKYCPYSELCTFSLNLILPKDNISSCSACSCRSDNSSKHSLCPDVLDFDSFGVVQDDPSDCVPMYLKLPKGYPYVSVKTIEAVYKCPVTDDGKDVGSYLCPTERSARAFATLLPATDNETKTTYINVACALCNGVSKENLVFWEPALICDERVQHDYKSEEQLIDFALSNPSCNIEYIHYELEKEATKRCNRVIRKCNVTGNWETHDPFISSACLFYENWYSIEVGIGKPRHLYRNIFCALCNGVVPSSFTVFAGQVDGVSPYYSFSGLLKLETRQETTTDHQDQCEAGFIYDFIKDRCVELLCSPMRKLENCRCELIYTEIRGVVYIFTARLYPVGSQTLILLEIIVLDEFEKIFRDVYFSSYFMSDRFKEFAKVCYKTAQSTLKDLCYNRSYSNVSCSLGVDYYDLELHFNINKYHSMSDILDRYSNLTLSSPNLTISLGNKLFLYEIKPLDFEYGLPDNIFKDKCPSKPERVKLSKQTACPLIELELSDYNWFVEKGEFQFNKSPDVVFLESQIHFGSNRSIVFVCFEIYRDKFAAFKDRFTKEVGKTFDPATIISLIFVSASLLCLLISFGTFLMFPSLRTLPGKANMSLILCLFIAQTFYLVGSFSQLEQDSIPCITVGLCTHFFWLLSIFWMNICTFHVFRVFTGKAFISKSKDFKTLIVYWTYSVVLSISFVGVNVVVSILGSDYIDLGYGKISCYISSEKMISFTFGLPVGFVVITNMTMFASAVFKLVKMPTLQKDVKHERNDIIIFAKLSTLTGFCWIFGFLYLWTDLQAFSYLFIILNSAQGIFLFLSFVCSRRVLALYKETFSYIVTKANSFKAKSTYFKSAGLKSLPSQQNY